MALAGQASTHLPHFEHSGMRPECGSSCSGQASDVYKRQGVTSRFEFFERAFALAGQPTGNLRGTANPWQGYRIELCLLYTSRCV